MAANPKGSIVKGVISAVEAKNATVDLGEGIEGTIRASEISRDRVEDARNSLTVGQEIEAKFVGVDRKNRTLSLSIKGKDSDEEASVVSDYSRGTAGPASTTLGYLLKEQMGNKNS